MGNFFLALLVGLWVGCYFGWRAAHVVLAAECERLGGFFVGKTVYRCTEVKALDERGSQAGGTPALPGGV